MAGAMARLLLVAMLAVSWAGAAPLYRRAISLPTPITSSGMSENTFQEFANIHLPPTISPTSPIGFHIQLGHNISIETNREVKLNNYSEVKRGLFAIGPVAFEAYNGTFCPPVSGFYQLSTIVHLTSSPSPPATDEACQVTVRVCLAGHCHDPHTASLEAVSAVRGMHTVTVSGLLYLSSKDVIVVHVRTNAATMATVWRHSSFMAFLWGRSD